RGRRGPSATGASPFLIVPRPREAELLHGQRGDSQRVHFQSHDLVAQADEAGRVVKRDEGGLAKNQLLGVLVGALAQGGIVRASRHVQERVDRRVRVAEVVRSAGRVKESAKERI